MRNISVEVDFSQNWTLSEINAEVSRWHRPLLIIVSVLLPVGYIGNSLVIFCNVKLYRLKKSTVRLLVLYLALADLISSVLLGPLFLYRTLFPLLSSANLMCQLYRFCSDFFFFSSLFTILAIAAERYNRICCPLKKQLSTSMTVRIVIGITLIALLLSVPRGIHELNTRFRIEGKLLACVCWRDVKESSHFHHIVNFTLLYVCGFVMISLYALVWFKLAKYRQNIQDNIENINDAKDISHPRKFYIGSRKSFIQISLTILSITLVFFFSYIPNSTIDMFFPLDHSRPHFGPDIFRETLNLGWLISHAFNPCVYGMCRGKCLLKCNKLFRCKDPENIEGEECMVTSIL